MCDHVYVDGDICKIAEYYGRTCNQINNNNTKDEGQDEDCTMLEIISFCTR